MKKNISMLIITWLCIAGFEHASYGQNSIDKIEVPKEVEYIFIVPYELNNKYKVILDYGQGINSPTDYKISNEDGTDRNFNSIGDVFNFMAIEWVYVESIKMKDDEGEYNSYLFKRKK